MTLYENHKLKLKKKTAIKMLIYLLRIIYNNNNHRAGIIPEEMNHLWIKNKLICQCFQIRCKIIELINRVSWEVKIQSLSIEEL